MSQKEEKTDNARFPAFCNLRLLNLAEGYWAKLNFEICSIIWSVTLFGICPKKTTFLTFMFFFTSQARRLVQMWRSKYGDNATPVTMIEALERIPLTRDIIDKIKKEFPLDSKSF